MSRRTLTVFPLLALCAAGTALGAERAGDENARATTIVQVGRPMPAVSLDVDLRDLPIIPEWQPGDPIKEIPRRGSPPEVVPLPVTDRISDPLLDRQPVPPEPNTRAFDVPILNFDAQNFTGANPPDTEGDVGPNHYIQGINAGGGTSIVVYNKTTGSIIAGPFLMSSLGAPAPCNTGFGDPIVLHDAIADRWLMAEFPGNLSANICIYVSKTPDPVTGGWWLYRLGPLTFFPDYPKFAVWPDGYYMTSNEGSNGPTAYALDRTNMLTGATARPAQRFVGSNLPGFGFEALTPADPDGSLLPPSGAPALFARHRDDEVHNAPGNPNLDFIDLWEFHVDFDTPGNSTFTALPSIEIADFSSEMCGLVSFACAPQPGTTVTLDPLREVVMWRLQYRNFGTHQALVGNFVTDADGEPDNPPNLERLGVRWFELRKTTAAWTLFQEGTHSPDANPRYMGAIAQDIGGNIALAYNISNNTPAIFPSLRYAGRQAGDPPGTLRTEVEMATGAAFNASNRYGDYAAMSVDPADDCTFWFTGMYNPVNSPANRWRTRIASFKFDSCGVAPVALAVDAAGNGVLDPNEAAVLIAPTWRNAGTAAIQSLTGVASNFTGPAGPTYTISDGTADYGAVAAGAEASCTITGDCYAVSISAGTRPAAHWDSAITEALSAGPAKTWTLHVGGSFTDVVPSSPFTRFIETLFHHGVTGGCGAGVYCPASSTTREQMAAFVLVAKEGAGYAPVACAPPNLFSDVPDTSPFCRFVEELAERQVVTGCGPALYCPSDPVTREQMAIFVLRTLDPALDPPACVAGSEMFADVPSTSPFCRWIEELANRGVVTGCGGGNYCPSSAVTREQMGVFLSATFGLTLYGVN